MTVNNYNIPTLLPLTSIYYSVMTDIIKIIRTICRVENNHYIIPVDNISTGFKFRSRIRLFIF